MPSPTVLLLFGPVDPIQFRHFLASSVSTLTNNPAYVFIPADMADKIPALYSTENSKDPVAVLKFFTPDSSWTWFLIEYDPEQRLAFGLVIGHERELGYFSLAELETIRGPMGLPIERDLHFKPTPVSACNYQLKLKPCRSHSTGPLSRI